MKIMQEIINKLKNLLKQPEKTRILAFGSSNTERFLPGMHWFDCLELAVKNSCEGRFHTCINTGVSGNTSSQLLERFVDDAERYKPHLVIITIGGNDSNPDPERNHSPELFAANLQELYDRFTAMGSLVVFQTYYSPDPDIIMSEHLNNFYALMKVVREVAEKNNTGLIDHLKRWEAFRIVETAQYKALMRDGFHVTPLGNKVIGLDLARAFGFRIGSEFPEELAEAYRIQKTMDKYSK